MKKIFCILLMLPFIVRASYTYTSIVAGGNWETNSTWSSVPAGGTYPQAGDNAIVNTNVTATSTVVVNNLTINSGETLTMSSSSLQIGGELINNGTLFNNSGGGTLFFGTGIVISGSGTYTQSGSPSFYFSNSPQTIDVGVNLTLNVNTSIQLYVTGAHNWYGLPAAQGITLTNNGTVSAPKGIYDNGGSASCPSSWIQGANSSLTSGNPLSSWDIFNATASGNTYTFSDLTATLRSCVSNTYYNFTLNSSGHVVSMPNALIITNNISFTSGILDATTSNYSLTVGGNWINNWGTSSFNSRAGTVTFNGSSGQTIGGTAASIFNNLILQGSGSETITLGHAETVSGNLTLSGGTLDCQTFQITGNASGTFSMAAGTVLKLGKTASATNVLFPSNFTNAHITLTATSTVDYLANTASQSISVVPTYANVLIDAGSAVTKTLTGSPLNISGNLTINANPTLSAATNTINLTGNLTNNGTLSFSTGPFNISGNFTNNGTYTAGTNTTTMAGSSGQTIGGTASTTFYNLTATGTGSETVTLGKAETVSNNLLISAGTFDVSASNYSLTVGGNLTTNGTLNTRSGLITLNGGGQTVGGTTAISFYDLTINETSSAKTVTLGTSESLQDALTMTTGTLAANAGNTMTLLSNAGRTARIARVVNSANTSITANFVVQRYEAARAANQPNYIGISSPVQAAQTIKDWNNSNQTAPNIFYMSGVGGPNGNAGSYVSVFLFDETKPNTNYQNYVAITHYASPGNTYTVTPGQGIYLWLGTSLSTMSNPFTYITNGIPTIANTAGATPGISVTVTNSGASNGNGQNLIGNPFCSPIDWVTFQADNPSLSTTFSLMQGDGSWHHYTTGSIAMGQAFMVQESGASATVYIKESHKTAVDAGLKIPERPLMEPANEPNAITFTLSNNANSFSCPATITFGGQYSKKYNYNDDGSFISSLTPGVPQLYTQSPDGYNISVYRLPDAEKTIEVPLTAVGTIEAGHTITVNGIENISSYQCVNLIDKATGTVLNNFNTNPSYSFYISKSGEEKHFTLQFTQLASAESCNSIQDVSTNIVIMPSEQGAIVNFNLQQTTTATISVCNLLGQKIMNDQTIEAYNNQLPLSLPQGQLSIIRIQTPAGIVIKKLYR